jgi:GNAT superfamily N-acetyltransferase
MVIKTYDAFTRLSTMEMTRLTNFVFEHYEGESISKKSIRKAMQYSAKEIPGLGGYVFVIEQDKEILGLTIINKTGMGYYIPENFIVLFVVNKAYKNQGIAEKLMEYAKKNCTGGISIHLKKNDPMHAFFQSNGFEEDYVELRLKRQNNDKR